MHLTPMMTSKKNNQPQSQKIPIPQCNKIPVANQNLLCVTAWDIDAADSVRAVPLEQYLANAVQILAIAVCMELLDVEPKPDKLCLLRFDQLQN
jgi:hypothetical protein